MKKIERKTFIKLSLMGSAAIYLNSCGGNSEKKIVKTNVEKEVVKVDTLASNAIEYKLTPTFKLYKKGDAEYESLRKGFNKRIQQFPAAIALCNSTEEVSQAVHYAIDNKLPVSIKSGGHSFEGFSCNNNGLVINLSAMNQVSWEDDDNTISLGPGCKLSELYDAILPRNKILPAGSCGGVGIGGLALGGGYGFFSRKYGLTCDSLVELTMVDGKGNILNTKVEEELLWACRGGGNGNFGVITSMKFKLKTAPEFFQSYRFKIKNVSIDRAQDVMEKWFSITENLPPTCFSAFVLNGKSVYILLTNYEDNVAGLPTIIDQLSAIVDVTTVGTKTPLAKALKVFYGRPDPLNFKNASAGFYKNFEDIRNCIPAVLEKVFNTAGMIYQINTLGGMVNDEKLGSKSSYAHRDQNYLSELQTYWESDSREEKMLASFEEVQQLLFNNGIKSQYRNYPDIHFINYQQAYYGNNYSRLQKVKLKFDPENIFNYAQGIKT